MADYDIHRIPKRPKAGQATRYRTLHAPKPELKAAQNALLKKLNRSGLGSSKHAFAYTRARGLKDMAERHVGATFALKMDLKDFFPATNWVQLGPAFNYRSWSRMHIEGGANYLRRICQLPGPGGTFLGLPQGAPTSPFLSNLACRTLDQQIAKMLQRFSTSPTKIRRRQRRTSWGGSYFARVTEVNHGFGEPLIQFTRYADDLTFSSTNERVLKIARNIAFLVNKHNYTVNTSKTVRLRKGARIEVCGVTVNERPNAPRAYRDAIRNQIHRAVRDVIAGRCDPGFQLDRGELVPIDVAALYGRLNFVQYLNPDLKMNELGQILLDVHGKERSDWSYNTQQYLQPNQEATDVHELTTT